MSDNQIDQILSHPITLFVVVIVTLFAFVLLGLHVNGQKRRLKSEIINFRLAGGRVTEDELRTHFIRNRNYPVSMFENVLAKVLKEGYYSREPAILTRSDPII